MYMYLYMYVFDYNFGGYITHNYSSIPSLASCAISSAIPKWPIVSFLVALWIYSPTDIL